MDTSENRFRLKSTPSFCEVKRSRILSRRYSASASSAWFSRSQRNISWLFVILVLSEFCCIGDACFPGNAFPRLPRRKQPPLLFKEYVPNHKESSPLASGPPMGRIYRDDARFKQLVTNNNPDIEFKDEEGTGEDRVMTRRCKEKLDNLAILVMSYWPQVRLRVTEAWDEEDIHPRDSLHYEGRAVDVITSDRDKHKMGMLGRLAQQAGFDYVLYEHRGHIHASVKIDSTYDGMRLRGCFPVNATVELEDGTSKQMHELAIGDNVLSANIIAGSAHRTHSRLVSFLDRSSSAIVEFVRIETSQVHPLTLTPYHLLYKQSNVSNGLELVFANDVRRGDALIVNDAVERVSSVTRHYAQGVYAPLTESGNLVVDGHLVSCYAGVTSQRVAHAAMFPLRFLYQVFGLSTFGDHDGVHPYARLLAWMNDLLGVYDFSVD